MTNLMFLIVTALLLVCIDIPIAIMTPSLREFLPPMLVAYAVMLGFAGIEFMLSRRLRQYPTSSLDTTVSVLATLRNTIAILNVVPLIQIFGYLIAIVVAPALLLTEVIVLIVRYSQLNRTQLPSQSNAQPLPEPQHPHTNQPAPEAPTDAKDS